MDICVDVSQVNHFYYDIQWLAICCNFSFAVVPGPSQQAAETAELSVCDTSRRSGTEGAAETMAPPETAELSVCDASPRSGTEGAAETMAPPETAELSACDTSPRSGTEGAAETMAPPETAELSVCDTSPRSGTEGAAETMAPPGHPTPHVEGSLKRSRTESGGQSDEEDSQEFFNQFGESMITALVLHKTAIPPVHFQWSHQVLNPLLLSKLTMKLLQSSPVIAGPVKGLLICPEEHVSSLNKCNPIQSGTVNS